MVMDWWKAVTGAAGVKLAHVPGNDSLCGALLSLSAAADEACYGVGIPPASDAFERKRWVQLLEQGEKEEASTLCRELPASRVVVLPKLHTPQSGTTIRSLSHHLALCPVGEVKAGWFVLPSQRSHAINLLLLPWPGRITPADFGPARVPPRDHGWMPDHFDFFSYEGKAGRAEMSTYVRLSKDAARLVGKIDGVVFPELALDPRQHELVIKELPVGSFAIAGVRSQGRAGRLGRNRATFALRLGKRGGDVTIVEQDKHHRWRLDEGQIVQYGLGSRLDPRKQWWEAACLGERRLSFFSMCEWLTMSVLICEDLARQDPISRLVRSVGPNLVVALLLDGPQLATRWSARYATVLADDPGCSVLTLTSLGMALQSRPPGAAARRIIGLWKDPYSGGPVQIDLPESARATILTLSREPRREWSADGRDDRGGSFYLRLSGIHHI
jgi:hypothetical protein